MGNISPQLHRVHSVTQSQTADVYILDVEITDLNGEAYRCDYVSLPDDRFGLAPTIRQWLMDNAGNFEVTPFVPPTASEIRAGLPPLSPRQLRLGLAREGVSSKSVEAALDALPEGQAKEEAEIEWEYATSYQRTAPALLTIAAAIGLTPERVDTMWEKALLI